MAMINKCLWRPSYKLGDGKLAMNELEDQF